MSVARNKVDTGFSERSLRLSSCLSLDLEVGVRDTRIHALAGVRSDTGQSLTFSNSTSLTEALAKLDGLAEGADFLLGHNLIDFDLPHLKAANPRLRLLQLPAVDTLRLNPLAFPRNPYHHLVKHYQDGGIRRGRINDPELDARLALEVFDEQKKALQDPPFDLPGTGLPLLMGAKDSIECSRLCGTREGRWTLRHLTQSTHV